MYNLIRLVLVVVGAGRRRPWSRRPVYMSLSVKSTSHAVGFFFYNKSELISQTRPARPQPWAAHPRRSHLAASASGADGRLALSARQRAVWPRNAWPREACEPRCHCRWGQRAPGMARHSAFACLGVGVSCEAFPPGPRDLALGEPRRPHKRARELRSSNREIRDRDGAILPIKFILEDLFLFIYLFLDPQLKFLSLSSSYFTAI